MQNEKKLHFDVLFFVIVIVIDIVDTQRNRSDTCVLNTLVMRGPEGSINLRPPPFEGWRGQK